MLRSAVVTVLINDRRISGPHGEIPLRTYAPDSGTPGRGLLWIHGGGFHSGDLDMPENDWVARQLAQRGLVVVTVDYRLSPLPTRGNAKTRHPYPVASEEIAAAFAWTTTSVPADGWAIAGASAGGNLAASATLRLRDTGHPLPRAMVLVYPVMHAALPPMPAELAAKVRTLPPELAFGADEIARMNLTYVQRPELLAESYAFPGGHDIAGLPTTLILNSDADSLRASGQQFAAELALAGVDVTVLREPGTHHGHLNRPDEPAASRSITRIAGWLTAPID